MPNHASESAEVAQIPLPRRFDLRGMSSNAGLMALLDALREQRIPHMDYTLNDLRGFCESAVQGRRERIGHIRAGSWCTEPEGIEPAGADARVDFVYKPTYLVIAILSKVLLSHPGIAIQVTGFRAALTGGLQFSTGRRLSGAGYDGLFGQLEAIDILHRGEIPLLLSLHPELCPEMATLLHEIRLRLEDMLARGQTSASVWPSSASLAAEMRLAVAQLAPLSRSGETPIAMRHDGSILQRGTT